MGRRYIGVRYLWGGDSPRGFDCSGFVQYVYARMGVQLPRVTFAQWHAGRHVPRRDLRPGDLVFFHHLRTSASTPGTAGSCTPPTPVCTCTPRR